MGKYLNPKDKPKEVWLFDNGFMIPNPCSLANTTHASSSLETLANEIIDTLVDGAEEANGLNKDLRFAMPAMERDKAFFDDYVIVDMVNNGPFRAAAVYTNRGECLELYNDREHRLEGDKRQRIWFVVKKDLAMAEIRGMIIN